MKPICKYNNFSIFTKIRLRIDCKMSLKESQGILDYESSDIFEKSLTINRSVNLFKANRDIILKHSNIFSTNNAQFVSRITA